MNPTALMRLLILIQRRMLSRLVLGAHILGQRRGWSRPSVQGLVARGGLAGQMALLDLPRSVFYALEPDFLATISFRVSFSAMMAEADGLTLRKPDLQWEKNWTRRWGDAASFIRPRVLIWTNEMLMKAYPDSGLSVRLPYGFAAAAIDLAMAALPPAVVAVLDDDDVRWIAWRVGVAAAYDAIDAHLRPPPPGPSGFWGEPRQ